MNNHPYHSVLLLRRRWKSFLTTTSSSWKRSSVRMDHNRCPSAGIITSASSSSSDSTTTITTSVWFLGMTLATAATATLFNHNHILSTTTHMEQNTTGTKTTTPSLYSQLIQIVGPSNVVTVVHNQNDNNNNNSSSSADTVGRITTAVTPHRLSDLVDVLQCILPHNGTIQMVTRIPSHSTTTTTTTTADGRPILWISTQYLNRIFPVQYNNNSIGFVCLPGVTYAQVQQFARHEFPHRKVLLLSPPCNNHHHSNLAAALAQGQEHLLSRSLCLTVSTNKWREQNLEYHDSLRIQNMTQHDNNNHNHTTVLRKMDRLVQQIDRWSRYVQQGYVRDLRKLEQESTTSTQSLSPFHCQGKAVILATLVETLPAAPQQQQVCLLFSNETQVQEFQRDVQSNNINNNYYQSLEYRNAATQQLFQKQNTFSFALLRYLLRLSSSSTTTTSWITSMWLSPLPPPEEKHYVRWTVYPDDDDDNHAVNDHSSPPSQPISLSLLEKYQSFVVDSNDEWKNDDTEDVFAIGCRMYNLQPWCQQQQERRMPPTTNEKKSSSTSPPFVVPSTRTEKDVPLRAWTLWIPPSRSSRSPTRRPMVWHECRGVVQGDEEETTSPHEASSDQVKEWKTRMDPLNVLNPGVGGTSSKFQYQE